MMKSINYQVDVSPELIKLVIVLACVLAAWVAHSYLTEASLRMGSQSVYGAQVAPSPSQVNASAQKLVSLSIVQSSTSVVQPVAISNDQLIEAAFALPAPVSPVAVKELEEKKVVSPAMVFLARYNPFINGIASNGAFINGHFYTIMEPIRSMPIAGSNGTVVNPKITKVSADAVSLDLGGTPLSLAFKSY